MFFSPFSTHFTLAWTCAVHALCCSNKLSFSLTCSCFLWVSIHCGSPPGTVSRSFNSLHQGTRMFLGFFSYYNLLNFFSFSLSIVRIMFDNPTHSLLKKSRSEYPSGLQCHTRASYSKIHYLLDGHYLKSGNLSSVPLTSDSSPLFVSTHYNPAYSAEYQTNLWVAALNQCDPCRNVSHLRKGFMQCGLLWH